MTLILMLNSKWYVSCGLRVFAVQVTPQYSMLQKEGTAKPSFTAELVEKDANPTPEQEMLYRWASVAFYSG